MSQKAKICHLSTVHRAFDTRVFHKECVTLAREGYDVSLVISHDKQEMVDGVKIVPLSMKKNRLFRVTVKMWQGFFKALSTKAKIVHIHDPELLIVGLWLKIFGRRVVFDMHELVYNQIADKKWLGGGFFNKMAARTYGIFEKRALKRFDAFFLAEDGYFDYFQKKYPNYLDKVAFVRNYPRFEMVDSIPQPKKSDDKLILIYAGGLTKIRGIKEVCDAVKEFEDVELWLMGRWQTPEYKRSCLEGNSNVVNFDLIPLQEVYEKMKMAHVGISTLYPVKNYLTSLPVKSFEYMYCELPMIMSDFPLWEEIFADCAQFVDPYSSDSIKEAIQFYVDNKDGIPKIGEKAKKDAATNYNWEKELETIQKHYQLMLS